MTSTSRQDDLLASTTRAAIYVGADGSWRDSGALNWALQEALLRHQPLHPVHTP